MPPAKPKIDIPVSGTETWLHRLAIATIGLSILLIALYYGQLPDRIPIHFDINGNPDSWSKKVMLWFLPIMLGATVGMLHLVSKMSPDNFNYPVKITAENAAYYYRKTRLGLALMNLVIGLMALFITWKMITIALGNSDSFSAWFIPGLLLAIALPIVIMVYPPYPKAK